MSTSANNGLSEAERKLLGVFARYGTEGRAITLESLAATAAMNAHSQDFKSALAGLERRAFIRRAGRDPIPGAPLAFRLARALDREEAIELPPIAPTRLRISPQRTGKMTDSEPETPRPLQAVPETHR